MGGECRVVDRELPLELAVQPGIGPAALLSTQEAATSEYTNADASDDQRRHHSNAVGQPGQRYAGQETGHRRQPCADPQLVGGEAAHDHRMPVQAVRQEGHEPITGVFLGVSHCCPPSEHAGGLGQQPDADDQQDGAHRHGQPELPPSGAAGVNLRIPCIGVVADANEH